ncbi:lipocalin family protein [Flavobacterium sp.]|uniref:lipocalin family protein n=1 Tax=Flavobacterium sp. TaxID=239 RepID=UPI004048150C
MKRKLLLLVSILSFSLTFNSCSNDDDNSSDTNGTIVGEWEFLKEGTIVSGTETLSAYIHTAGCTKDYLEFKSNGIAEDYSYEKPAGSCIEYVDSATWTKDGNALSINYGGGDFFNGDILILNNTTLKIRFTDDGGTINVVEFVRK